MDELTFSFTDCTPVPKEPQISVMQDGSGKSDYTLVVQAARNFRGWLTITAYAVIRNVVRTFRRTLCEAEILFNRQVLIRQGGLRL